MFVHECWIDRLPRCTTSIRLPVVFHVVFHWQGVPFLERAWPALALRAAYSSDCSCKSEPERLGLQLRFLFVRNDTAIPGTRGEGGKGGGTRQSLVKLCHEDAGAHARGPHGRQQLQSLPRLGAAEGGVRLACVARTESRS